ncbi:MAG: ABC transporter substrate-binding protein [Sedimentisphaerales bacterium]
MLRKDITYILLFFLLAIAFLPGCGKKPQEPKLTSVTIAFQEWVGYGLFYLADEKGFFKEEGIEIVFIDEQLDSARRDAFKQGMLDCEAGTLDLLISKAAQDTPIVGVMKIDRSFGGDGIVAVEDINKLEDLIGKKIALARDDVGETFISTLFHKNRLSLNNVIIVPKQPEEVSQAFLNDEADACVTWEPQLTEALKRPGSHILTSTKKHPAIIIDTLNVRRDLVENNPGLVKRLMRGWFKALKFYKEHPNEASEIIAKYYKITPEQYRKQVEGLLWEDFEEQQYPSQYKEWVEIFDVIAELKLANGRISQKPDASKSLNHTILENIYYEDSK